MKIKDKIESFIELRAHGKTYDEITAEIGVSKPTLVKWNREFKGEIKLVRQAFTRILVEKIVENNERKINMIAAKLELVFTRKSTDEIGKQMYANKYVKELGDIFGAKVKSFGFSLNDTGEIELMKIDFYE